MKSLKLTITFICVCIFQTVFSQTPAGEELLGLSNIPSTEFNNITSPIIGSLLYNPTDENVYVYTTTGWKTVTNPNDLDSDNSNELNTTIILDGTDLKTTDAGGTIITNLSSLVDDADADDANELNETVELNGTNLETTDAGGTITTDLSSLVSTVTQTVTTGNTIATYTSAGTTTNILETNTTLSQNDASPTGEITYTNEAGTPSTAQIVAAETDNQIEVGANGGAYLGPTVYVGQFIITATGTQTVSGLPFEPSSITFVAHANVETLDLDSDNGTRDNETGLANSFGTMNGFARNDSGTITQQVIYVGGSGNSINDISRYASSTRCIGLRYGNQNGDALGRTLASLTAFNSNGFTLNVTNKSDNVVVLYTAYK